jgi:tRNA U34 2-thiouridine synthase MnmA/TrmU
MNRKAVALLSGGLDSTLAILAVLKQGIEVKAIKFRTPFDSDTAAKASGSFSFSVARRFCLDVEITSPGEGFLAMVKDPKHGYGKNMNPCIDCRIFMLKEARKLMDMIAADFIITGEVIGQRPMSQKKDMLYHIDREAGVTDFVLRPLSAKLLKMTAPEERGLINREMFYDFSGRSRKPQIALAREFGLEDYPLPAGGCLLTEPNYANRLKDLMAFNSAPSMRDIDLLRIGRHFRFSPSCKIVIGRDKVENEIIESLAADTDCLLRIEGYGSPLTLVTAEITDEVLRIAASLCARYSDAKGLPSVNVSVFTKGLKYSIEVQPAGDDTLRECRIELKKQSGKQVTSIK